jgi:tetratricopeptide (TPR) repeat protein
LLKFYNQSFLKFPDKVTPVTSKSVFISSTSKDLLKHREAVNTVINKLDMRAIDMKYFGSRPGDAVEISLDQVGRGDFFVGIIAHRYGFVPDGMDKSVTEQEYDEAVKRDIPCLMYLVDTTYAWPTELVETDLLAQQRLATFKAKVEANEVRSLFTTPENLAASVSVDLANVLNDTLEVEARQIARQKPSRISWGQVVAAIMLLSAVVSTVYFLIDPTAQDTLRRLGILPPQKMPITNDGFNVVVVGLGVEQVDGSLIENDLSRNYSEVVYEQVQQFETIAHHLGPDDIGVQAILESTTAGRANQAQTMAQKLGADIVIYGYLEPIGNGSMSVYYHPEFYIAAEWVSLESEFINTEEFGRPVQILSGQFNNSEIISRIESLDLFLNGLSAYILGNYQTALDTFEQIVSTNSELEVVYIFAGNAAFRLNNYQGALEYYTQSLQTGRPNYSRGLLGRGIALKKLAIISALPAPENYNSSLRWPTGTPCAQSVNDSTPIELMLDLALICFTEADSSPDQTATNDIEVKVLFERADLFAWQSANGYGEFWDAARNELQTALDIYNNADAAKQARIRTLAGALHGYLAQIIIATDGNRVAAIAELEAAIAILRQDIAVQRANEIITTYTRMIATLETEMTAEAP